MTAITFEFPRDMYDFVEYEYDESCRNERSCDDSYGDLSEDGYECDHEYNRCRVIDKVWCTEIDYDGLAMKLIGGGNPDPLVLFVVDRILRQDLTTDDIEFVTTGGYYGEEVERSFVNGWETPDFDTIGGAIRYWLQREYGKILPVIAEVTDWKVITVPIERVEAPPSEGMSEAAVEAYEGRHMIFPVGLARPRGERWALIDGRHRFEAARRVGRTEVQVVVPT